MTPAYAIRPVTPADVPAVAAHVRQVLAEFGITFGVGATSDDELLELPGSYERQGGRFWIAEEAATKRLVGTAGIARVDQETFELRKMYLLPETRGHGLGAALFKQALAFAREHGGRKVILDTVEQMQDAIAFYERHGFVRDDRYISAPRCTRGYVLAL